MERRKRGRLLLILPALVAAVVFAAVALGQGSDPATVYVFPSPGTPTASPRSEISFRGVKADQLGEITVSGSRSGQRTGRVVAHSDGQGASLVFDRPARAPERITVQTALNVAGGRDGDFSFTTAPRPKEGLGSGGTRPPRALAQQLFGQRGAPPRGAAVRYRSAPRLRPVDVEITRRERAGASDGFVFLSPKKVFGARDQPGAQRGPLILDGKGEPVWFASLPDGNVNDFRPQRYQGKPVLTWWQGRQVLGTGEGEVQILDQSYRPLKRIRAGNGYQLDFHEGFITERGTFLGIVYSPVPYDLRPVGGRKNGRIIDSVIQEIDIETGRVLFEWHSIQHIPITDGYGRQPPSPTQPYDYFHANSVSEDTDGNLIVSAREVHTVYKIDRKSGRIIWRLGGKRSSFKMPRNARPAWQHDAQRDPDGTIRIFDNQAAPRLRPKSRVLWLRLNEENMTASVARQFEHPDDLSSGTQGNAQALPNGNVFIGWGSQGYFTEITKNGNVLLDGRVARGNDSYRAYRGEWVGTPGGKPAVAAQRSGDRATVWASWNGATEVATWEVLAGARADALQPAGSARRSGFETAIRVPAAAFVAVRAKDASGKVLGTSDARRVRAG